MAEKEPSPLAITFEPFKFAVKWLIILSTLWLASNVMQGIWLKTHQLRAADHIGQVMATYLDGAPSHVTAAADATWDRLAKIRGIKAKRDSDSEKLSSVVSRAAVFGIPDMVEIVVWNTVLVVIKLYLASVYMGLYVLILALAGLDGWIARYIRKVNAGHESATLYHFSKFWGSRLLPLTALAIYLCCPVAIDVNWVMMPALVAHAILLRTQFKYYKKYI